MKKRIDPIRYKIFPDLFSPNNLIANKGDSVRFTNMNTEESWIDIASEVKEYLINRLRTEGE